VWVFGDTPLNAPAVDGSRWRSSTWGWAEDFRAGHRVTLREPVDRNGAPGEFLPFTPEELAYNAAHNRETLPEQQRSRWGLWTGPLVVDPKTGKALVFYIKMLCKSGPWAFEEFGRSIAVWEKPERTPVRPEVKPGADDPKLLFPRGDVPLGAGVVALGDWIYAYGCRKKG
jgi:hypothetical protein